MKNLYKTSIVLFFLTVGFTAAGRAQSLSEKVAKSAMKIWPDTSMTKFARWTYDEGVLLEGMAGVWKRTADADYYSYIQKSIDKLVDSSGTIKGYKSADFNIDNIKMGRALLLLYRVTESEKYYKALIQLREQLKNQYQKISVNQMQPDDWFNFEPFAAEYAAVFDEPAAFDTIANQFILKVKPMFNPKKGFNGNAMGSYGMALVDVLEYFPENNPQRKALLAILNRFAAQQQYQNLKTGTLVYTLAKGMRLGYLSEKYKNIVKKGYQAMVKNEVAGNIKKLKDVGIFILAANEMELAEIPKTGKGQTVMLDSYFNNEFMKDVTGQTIPFHYKWDEMDNNGFYFFKNAFNYHGVKTATLNAAPTVTNLKGADIYIIVDPDTEKETDKPNYMNATDADAVANWVKAGGVLVLMANDLGNSDLTHFNILAERFGIHFNEDSYNKVTGREFAMGAIQIPTDHAIFKTAKKVYIKELSTLKLTGAAVPVITKEGHIIVATAKYGKGIVFAVGDPWFYDEYTDGRKLPADYDNFNACEDVVLWLSKQVPAKPESAKSK